MKCPERYKTVQQNIILFMLDDDNISRGENRICIETQDFHECYKERCAAWDKENQMCRKVESE